MIIARQYAVTKVFYKYYIRHPSEADIRFIGSDISSDNNRVLRVKGSNVTNVGIKLRLGGNFTTGQKKVYNATFGIVNEQNQTVNITHINVSSNNYTYLKIWLHGDRGANAESNLTDSSTVYMWNNNTLVDTSNITAWSLTQGNQDT